MQVSSGLFMFAIEDFRKPKQWKALSKIPPRRLKMFAQGWPAPAAPLRRKSSRRSGAHYLDLRGLTAESGMDSINFVL